MADQRHPFGGGIADWAFAADTDGGLALAHGMAITFWDARVGGTQFTDLATDAAGTSTMTQVSSVAVAEDGYVAGDIPVFFGPPGVTVMWASAGGGPRRLMISPDHGLAVRPEVIVQDRLFDAADYGARLDGVSDDTAAIQAAINAAAAHTGNARSKIVHVAGIARISAPLLVPPLVTVRGGYAAHTQTPAPPAMIKTLPTFQGAAMIRLLDQTLGGYSTPSCGQRIHDLTLDGGDSETVAVDGIRADGDVQGVTISNVAILAVSGTGLWIMPADTRAATSWRLDNVHVRNAGGTGFGLTGLRNSTITGCAATACVDYGWEIIGCAHTTFTDCRADHNLLSGFQISGAWGNGPGAGGATWLNCSTDRNHGNGFYLAATGTPPLVLTNIYSRRDGRNGGVGAGGYAGVRIDGATTPISISNLVVYPGVNDDGTGTNSPQYGLRANGATWVSVNSGYLHAAAFPHQNISGNTYYHVAPGVGQATGTTAAPVRI